VSEPHDSLARWIDALVSTPGLTGVKDAEEAWRVHVEDSLRALPVVRAWPGSIVDVGSGGGAPGVPLAAALPDRQVTLLEANARKAEFLRRVAQDFPNISVVAGRAEEQELEQFDVAVAKALAHPPVALEWCLPLVRVGGAVILYVGQSADRTAVQAAAEKLGGGDLGDGPGVLVVPKMDKTPPEFPRRPGMAKKRPLA
jgi:16S rRNA (guanine527-N7)-methyltransferase